MMNMDDRLKCPISGPLILLFGSLPLSFDEASFTELRKTVIEADSHDWILKAIAELPQCWRTIIAALPNLEDWSALNQLENLDFAFRTGQQLKIPFPLPNALLIPLAVISHLAQYTAFLHSNQLDLDNKSDHLLDSKHGAETLGFCTGLLSAFAVSSATHREEFVKYGAVAVRLGLLIGMVVDSQDRESELGTSKSLATLCNTAESAKEVLRVLKHFPEAYVSVYYDEYRVTVTAASSTVSKLQQQLKSSGVMVSEVGLFGRFHAECHRPQLSSLVEFCNTHPEFQLPDASQLVIPTRSNSGGELITQGTLHSHALTSILVEPPQWYRTFSTVRAGSLNDKNAAIFSFGSERCIPPSLMRGLSQQVVYVADRDLTNEQFEGLQKDQRTYSDNDIAVVGMSCKVAGAEDLEEFWNLLCSGKSQHREVPKERFGFETAFRDTDPKRKWFGNFVNGHDMFDHKFFKRSPRESATMDPQQRHLLQIAYQAVEQSGYFHSANPEKNIGCYIGVCATDYENNIACHAPNAFSATGNLQGFIAGKVSHYFGWTGPGLTIDTACSSSTVAVHQACRAIISGECNAALAGGTHIMSGPLWFQNLAGASFLSTTGQCKPFDADADGYCRGEGIAAVFLKKASAAIADGDQILGVIAATAVQQNQNCTPIFVPNVPSLSSLFYAVTNQARIKPAEISVVEAHGTGTAVGDPAEYDSIRKALGGPARAGPLALSSVKGLVGHIECTSGIVSIIKVLLMIQKGMIPPQASFNTINPAIDATPADNMSIPTKLQAWNTDFKAALINNYGASGSNASMVITQPLVPRSKTAPESPIEVPAGTKFPFWFCGLDDQSLRRYSEAFRKFIAGQSSSTKGLSLSNISFNLARQSNRSLERSLMFSVRSVDELLQKLEMFEKGDMSVASAATTGQPRPVVLCFGGQVSTFIGLDPNVYKRVAILQKHLDTVDAAARSLGAGSIFPSIFERSPIQDTVKLQLILFAMQYACAHSWIDSGIQPAAVVGHSFGELTALCVSQILSLEDSLRMVVSRATLVRDAWGGDKGAMIAVEADVEDVEKLLSESSKNCPGEIPASIACYNGPRSFTIAGSTASIEAVAAAISTPAFSSMRAKRLNVTNAFHCALLDPLLQQLEQVSKNLNFGEPVIPMERATEFPHQEKLTPRFVSDHIRSPVFFHHAVERLSKRHLSCIFLEAGSNSTITSMASRALGNPGSSHFHAVNITCDNGINNLTDTTLSLWRAGLKVHHWPHQIAQTKEHTPLLLPPYQFDKVSHWIELRAPPKVSSTPPLPKEEEEKVPDQLLTFVGYQDGRKRLAKFQINTMISKYDRLIVGHVIAETEPICPSTVQLDLVVEAIRNLRPDLMAAKLMPQIHGVQNQSPICINPARAVWIEVNEDDTSTAPSWNFEVFSTDLANSALKTLHTTGKVLFRPSDDLMIKLEFARFERLIGHQSCLNLLTSGEVDEILKSTNIYRIFAEIVDYGEDYRGLEKLVGRGNQSAGYVVRKCDSESWLDAHLVDSFCQVGGIWVNCMTDRAPTDIFIANGIEQWIRSPKFYHGDLNPKAFHVFATHHHPSETSYLTDVFVFNASSGALVEAILGISYVRIPKVSMSKLLSCLTVRNAHGCAAKSGSIKVERAANSTITLSPESTISANHAPNITKPAKGKKQSQSLDVSPKVKAILVELSGLELDEIKDDSQLADLGIDSLMGMEMAHEIEQAFNITLPESELMQIVDMCNLLKCVQSAVKRSTGGEVAADSDYGESDDSYERSNTNNEFTASTIQTNQSTPVPEAERDLLNKEPTGLELPFATVMEAFNETKQLTDEKIAEYNQTNYVDMVMPVQTQLCIALTLEAFDELGYNLREAKPGQKLARVSHPSEHRRLVDYLYRMLAKEALLINLDDDTITRTTTPPPPESSKDILEQLLKRFPDQNTADRLTFYTGSNLAEVLRGNTDGIKLIFCTEEGRELVSGLYADWPLNRLFYSQMEDFLCRLISKLDMSTGPLKILEMGAGTGGTTKWIVPLLAKLNVPIEYTFTDLAPSFVAGARKKFKPYQFMKFRTHDIEKAPADDLIGTQHVVIASNAVHATHSLCESAKNIRKALRPDGLLMMLEMTGTLYWVDMIFGLFEGWWFFDDGRTHAVTCESRWEKDLQSVGYGHVDWTDGNMPENKVEKLIIAMASGSRCDRLRIPSTPKPIEIRSADCAARQAVVNKYVQELTDGFAAAVDDELSASLPKHNPKGKTVLVTGATGSLGSHIIAKLAILPDIRRVVCLNRRSRQVPKERQQQALTKKGISINPEASRKLCVIETDLSKPNLGLLTVDYEDLVNNVTDIIHNAWLMNAKWPVKNFTPQLQIMRNLLNLARKISSRRSQGTKVTFEFISSIATVGHWPIWTGKVNVPEERMTIESVIPTGYGDAKYICECMLDETLHKYPDRFRATAIRLGQVGGSSASGYWNPMEHLSFVFKSSQTLQALPDFDGLLSWTPVDDVASTLVDILMLPEETTLYPIYHIDNPVRQPWKEMIPVLADAMDIPPQNVIPFKDWVQRVTDHPRRVEGPEGENPAIILIDFLDGNFLRMSCGGLLLDTAKAREHSRTLANVGPVSERVARLFVKSWKDMGFLN
ncbi:Type I Iterative PKS [Coccidioides posadasii str. Silveira]|nr:Type I Iterative PKS [Coccidioides posadasii str. Silveira]